MRSGKVQYNIQSDLTKEIFVKTSRLVFSSFVAASLIFTGTYNLNVSAQSSRSWVRQAFGSYQSQIWNGGSLVSGTTEFRKTSEGFLAGSYKMNVKGESVLGTLTKCQAKQVQVMRCVWNDKYGTGSLEVTFSESFSSFNGYWGEGISEPTFRWNGSR
jgi:hypothetical protein